MRVQKMIELVEQLILNRWFLQRNERRYSEVEQHLASVDFTSWTDQHKLFQLAARYKTAAERSVTRAMNELENFVKTRHREEKDSRREFQQAVGSEFRAYKISDKDRINQKLADIVQVESRARSLFQGQNSPKKMRRIPLLDQWIEITIEDGKTVTTLYPPNDVLIAEGQAMDPPPQLVYRRMNFPSGVPVKYEWTTRDPMARKYGGLALQRVTIDTWLHVIDREKTRPGGHIGVTGVGNYPRPKEHGPCPCESCTEAAAKIDAKEIEEKQPGE